jgi:hypothetical protein
VALYKAPNSHLQKPSKPHCSPRASTYICDRESSSRKPVAFEILHREKTNKVFGSVFTRLLALFSVDVDVPAASSLSISTSNQYASSDLISFFSLSVVIDVICILFNSLLIKEQPANLFTVEFNLKYVYLFNV